MARVSTREQAENGASLASQSDTIVRECDHRRWRLLEVFEDAGYSGKDLKRPGLQAALEALATRRADVLVVAKLDRLSRSVLDFAGLVDMARRQGWQIVALDMGFDMTTPAGEAMANMMATFAQFERRVIGQRTKDALAVKRSQGVRLGRPPSLSADTVARIRELREEGLSLQQIADRLNEDGVATGHGAAAWRKQSVAAVLARPAS